MMNTDESEELNPPLSILQRLDHLDRLKLLLEEKHCLPALHSAAVEKCEKPEDQGKSLSSALEEVHQKGTLMERVTLLENRVIQLSLDMDLGNISRSSSSTSAVAEELGHESGLPEARERNEDMNMVTTRQEKQDPLTQDSIVVEACSLNSPSCWAPRTRRRRKTMSRVASNRKWLKWLKLGC